MLHLFGCMPSSETSSGKTFQKWFSSLIKLVDQIDRYFLRWQRRLYTLMCTAKSSRTILKSWFRSYIKQDVLGISSEIQLVQKSSFVPHRSVWKTATQFQRLLHPSTDCNNWTRKWRGTHHQVVSNINSTVAIDHRFCLDLPTLPWSTPACHKNHSCLLMLLNIQCCCC